MTSQIEFLTAPVLEHDRLIHAFTTRPGGVSAGPYASLNLTRSRGDSADHVSENRRRVREALGLDYLVFAKQVHGCDVIAIDAPPLGEQPAGEADALMTDKPGIGLVCQTADCTPILMHDPENGAVAAIHSGWRGTVQNIVEATVAAMAQHYGSKPADLRVAIGPSVSAGQYRVGPEVVAQFETGFPDPVLSLRDEDGGAQLDVAAACAHQLRAAGIAPEHLTQLPHCTYSDETRFFSARRSHHRGESGQFGGQGGIIALRGVAL
ncbi:peptidoglycan editing factor PgeF [Maricaulis sp.]|uniref:peptidoglycan editing factor PgeF n=1 Tax=Maricaulis sp. TaxID=1486257 RepID=UPI00263395A7|nr:peptidoglycan editing factor PgeF [Maricaulis sp.]